MELKTANHVADAGIDFLIVLRRDNSVILFMMFNKAFMIETGE